MWFDIDEAAASLNDLIVRVSEGEEIVITKQGRSVAMLILPPNHKKAKLGTMAGTFKLPKDWDAPIGEHVLNEWL